MKLKDALETGWHCGMKTVGECIDNVDFHAMMIFTYDELEKEMLELFKEFSESNLRDESSTKTALKNLYDINTDDLDRELEDEMRNSL